MKAQKSTRSQVVSKQDKKSHADFRKLRRNGGRGKMWSSVA